MGELEIKSRVIQSMREFFLSRNFVEVYPQKELALLSACEDPKTVIPHMFNGETWALHQTNQNILEFYLMENPHWAGCFCLTTSYRNEPNPVPGRHAMTNVFDLFEFETHGGMENMIQIESDLLRHLGFRSSGNEFPRGSYLNVAKSYNTEILDNEHELRLESDFGPVFFLTDFPRKTSPYFNMRAHEGPDQGENHLYYKVDVIVGGMETFGSAERSCNPEEMRHDFSTISGGEYASMLYQKFTKRRTLEELDRFLALPMIQRAGGGIGVDRLISAMKKYNLC